MFCTTRPGTASTRSSTRLSPRRSARTGRPGFTSFVLNNSRSVIGTASVQNGRSYRHLCRVEPLRACLPAIFGAFRSWLYCHFLYCTAPGFFIFFGQHLRFVQGPDVFDLHAQGICNTTFCVTSRHVTPF